MKKIVDEVNYTRVNALLIGWGSRCESFFEIIEERKVYFFFICVVLVEFMLFVFLKKCK